MARRLTTDEQFIAQVLDESEVGHVAFEDDGYLYLVPLLCAPMNGRLYFHSAPTGHMMDLIRAGKRLMFCAYVVDKRLLVGKACEYAIRYRSVQGKGTARIVTDPAVKVRALNAITARLARGHHFEPATEANLQGVAVVEITFDSIVGKQNF
jgi:hypothetical protein